MTTMTGHQAIEYAAAHGLTLSKYADPTEDAREGLTVDEAREIAREDPSLIYVEALSATTYAIRTISGRGLPVGTDADGYDTRLAAEEMADAFHDGEYEIVETERA